MKLPITAIVLTYNETRNLAACLNSLKQDVDQIIIVDSFSTDDTLQIATEYGCDIFQNPFINQAKQFAWALQLQAIKNEWIMRVDADERWTAAGFNELRSLVQQDCNGIFVRMKIYFMGKPLKYGGMANNLFLRVFKREGAYIEDRWMDEHIVVPGNTIQSNIQVLEMNYDRQENMHLWTTKHNNYSTREAVDFLIAKHKLISQSSIADVKGNKLSRKRWIKEKVYFKIPYLIRPFGYFIYRYIFLLGFLDGYSGFIFHYLHAFWYRFLADVKAYQIEQLARQSGKTIPECIQEHYNISI